VNAPARTSDNAPAVQAPAKKTLRTLIEDMKPEIARALPSHMTPERMARIATTAIKQNPKLGECTPDSFLGALMTAAQLGLEPNTPLGEAYLVPFKNKNKATNRYEMVCTYIQGYRGLVQLAHRSGQVAMVKAQVVYEKDDFDFEEGLDAHLKHKRSRDPDPGEVIWVYAMVKLKDGGSNFVVMTVPEVEAIRKRSRAADSGPWVTDWNAMAKKTALKQLSKWMPLSPEFAVAARLDDTVRRDMNTDLVDVQPDYVDGEVIEDAPTAVDAGAAEDTEPQAEPPTDEPPQDPGVMMAGPAEFKRLAQIRKAERLEDPAAWFDYVQAATGATIGKDADLTLDQAQHIIGIFDADAATQ
jgi:recombination protein RecT